MTRKIGHALLLALFFASALYAGAADQSNLAAEREPWPTHSQEVSH